jgi:hypothetical protein
MRVILASIAVTLAVIACSDRPAVVEAHDYAQVFSLAPLQSPEVRIWVQDFESGRVTGYAVRPGVVTVYSDYLGEPERREVRTTSADELIRMIPQLRRVRTERCQLVMDGSGVVLEGRDSEGRFVFRASNHAYCEGYNLHVLDRALGIAQTVIQPGYDEVQL